MVVFKGLRTIILQHRHHLYLRHPPPVCHLCLQAQDFCRQPVDLLLRPDDFAEVHLVAVEALVAPRRPRQEGGSGRGGSGGGSSGDGQHGSTGGGGLSRPLQLLDIFLESTLPSFEVADLHLRRHENVNIHLPIYALIMEG